MKKEVFGYHIFPPFIDAYRQSFDTESKLSISDIAKQMESHAIEWGEQSLGQAVLRGNEIPKYNNKIILCCAYTYTGENNDRYKEYLIVVTKFGYDWYDNLEFIEGVIENEWDVT